MIEEIDCPHCGGCGKVPEDFLTEEHVSDVFKDYCEVFGIHRAYGVESYSEGSTLVSIVQDTSCRGCYDTERHELPHAYFTRDRGKRLALMRADFNKKEAAKQEASKKAMQARLAAIAKEAASIRTTLGEV